MSYFLNYEGTADYIAATPYLAVTLAASGSVTAGRAVVADTNNPAYVYQPSGQPSGSVKPVGVALATVADGAALPVLVWGYAKSLPALPTARSFGLGNGLVVTGSGQWSSSGSAAGLAPASEFAGKIVSGSAGYIFAFIDCLRNV
jgi:hypothetical protein